MILDVRINDTCNSCWLTLYDDRKLLCISFLIFQLVLHWDIVEDKVTFWQLKKLLGLKIFKCNSNCKLDNLWISIISWIIMFTAYVEGTILQCVYKKLNYFRWFNRLKNSGSKFPSQGYLVCGRSADVNKIININE